MKNLEKVWKENEKDEPSKCKMANKQVHVVGVKLLWSEKTAP